MFDAVGINHTSLRALRNIGNVNEACMPSEQIFNHG